MVLQGHGEFTCRGPFRHEFPVPSLFQARVRDTVILAGYGAFGTVVWESISAAYGGFVSANSRPSAARTVALSVPTRGLRPLERWLCQCQAWVLPTLLRYRNLADRTAKFSTMDNGTMVEAFKYLDYSQLAKRSLISKGYRDLIRTHRHSLPRHEVFWMKMEPVEQVETYVQMFHEELSAETYDEWVIRNQYSKQIPLESQIVGEESTQLDRCFYELQAWVDPPDPNTRFLSAYAELNHDNWPLFQHFVRLLSDPFVYFRLLVLDSQNDVLKLLTGVINPDRGRLQCEEIQSQLHVNIPKFINWAKDHIRCLRFSIDLVTDSDLDQELLNFFVTGARCTSAVIVQLYNMYDVVVDFVKKFRDLQSGDEYQFVQRISSSETHGEDEVAQLLKDEFHDSFVGEEFEQFDKEYATYKFEFNNGIGKKLLLSLHTSIDVNVGSYTTQFSVDIKDL
ncbi:hypothetical protein Ddc_00087 [Ditylenchus destructor]|nr:hypothetical protein Ddc_00087 [Ditylenchus destructor]